jgi:hypothetical protein
MPDAAVMRAQLILLHNLKQAQFVEYRAVESFLKRLLCEATSPDLFTALKHETYHLAKVTCKQMITHLWTRLTNATCTIIVNNSQSCGIHYTH